MGHVCDRLQPPKTEILYPNRSERQDEMMWLVFQDDARKYDNLCRQPQFSVSSVFLATCYRDGHPGLVNLKDPRLRLASKCINLEICEETKTEG